MSDFDPVKIGIVSVSDRCTAGDASNAGAARRVASGSSAVWVSVQLP